MKNLKFRIWILSPKQDWLGVYNYETFDWDNRMRQVSSIHFPLGSFSGKDISCEAICEDDNYASGWHGAEYKDHDSLPEFEYVLMQFTGLHDKNGKEIYEGDIIRYLSGKIWKNDKWNNNYEIFEVIYKDYCFQPFNQFHLVKNFFNSIEIIGNIHANPELLNPKDNEPQP